MPVVADITAPALAKDLWARLDYETFEVALNTASNLKAAKSSPLQWAGGVFMYRDVVEAKVLGYLEFG